MSSPAVITGVSAPEWVARAANRDDALEFLALAEDLAAQLAERAAKLRSQGVIAPVATRTPQSVRALVESKLSDSDAGFAAMKLAHAYWQSLKHDVEDALDHLESAEQGRQELAAVAAVAAEHGRLKRISDSVILAAHSSESIDAAQGTGIHVADALAQRLETLRAAAVVLGEDADVEAKIAEILSADVPAGQRRVALDVLCVSLQERAVQVRRHSALAAILQSRLEQYRETAVARLQSLMQRCEELAAADRITLEQAILETQGQITSLATAAEMDARVDELRKQFHDAVARRTLFGAVAAALQRQGYEEVEVLQTLRPGDIRARYFIDSSDDDRVIEIGLADGDMTLSAEVVRVRAATDSQAKIEDREAQQSLCGIIDAAAASQREGCRVEDVSRVPPGAPLRVETRLAALLESTTKSKRGAASAKERSL